MPQMNEIKNQTLAELHAQGAEGIVHSLQQGVVPNGKKGTDKDAEHCLGNDVSDPRFIKRAGHYILSYVPLDIGSANLVGHLEEALQSVRKYNINGPVKLRMLSNAGDDYWRLIKVSIKNQAISAVTLWDPLLLPVVGDRLLCESLAFKNMQDAVLEVLASQSLAGAIKQPQPSIDVQFT